jgi:NAD(P)-dependent dehydrogenase (short-subunit alcohol dehydrogenase family)
MPETGCVVVVGGTSGVGREVATLYAERGREVVLSGRDPERAAKVAAEVGASARGIGLDLTHPAEIVGALADVGPVDHLVVAAIDRDHNVVGEYDVAGATSLVTLKLIGAAEVVHVLLPRISPDGSIVLFGGQAKDLPYPGSLTVSTVNYGTVGMVHALAVQLAPIRVNGIHPGFVGDSPYWTARPPEILDAMRARTPTGRLATMRQVAEAVAFLLENPAVNGTNLNVNGGRLLM